jgi:hypothetical protein
MINTGEKFIIFIIILCALGCLLSLFFWVESHVISVFVKSTPLDDVVNDIVEDMTEKDIVEYKKESEKHPGSKFHFFGGMAMRNNLGLWRNDSPLTNWFSENGVFHGDDRSATIYKALWCKLNDKPFDIKKEASHYQAYWKQKGVNPDGTEIS